VGTIRGFAPWPRPLRCAVFTVETGISFTGAKGDSTPDFTHPYAPWVFMWQFYRRPLWISIGSCTGHISCAATYFRIRCLWWRVDDHPLGKLCPRVTSLVVLLRLPCKAFDAGSAGLPCGPAGWSGMGRGSGDPCEAAWSMAIVGRNGLTLKGTRPDEALDGYRCIARTCALTRVQVAEGTRPLLVGWLRAGTFVNAAYGA